MANGIFNISKGSFVEKIRDAASNVGIIILKANESESTLLDRADVAAILAEAGNTEADFTNYARKTGITGVITVDNTNDRVDVDFPDQTFSSAGGASNNTLTKLVTYYEDSASDAGRVPMSHHDFAATTDGNDLIAQVNAAGAMRAE